MRQQESRELWKIMDVAKRLNVSVWVIYRWVQRQAIPHLRIPGVGPAVGKHDEIRFDPDVIETWLKNNRRDIVV